MRSCCIAQGVQLGTLMTYRSGIGQGIAGRLKMGGGGVCIHIADSHCCTAETNTALLSSYCCCLVTKSCLTLLPSHGLQTTRLLCPWGFPGKNAGVSCHFFLQWIFSTQGSNLSLLHWQADSLPVSHQGNPKIIIYQLKINK